MCLLLEKVGVKSFQFFPLRTDADIKYMPLDTASIISLFVDGNTATYNSNINIYKHKIWSTFFNLDHPIFKQRKQYAFDYKISTDCYAVSIQFIRKDQIENKNKKSENSKATKSDQAKEMEDMTTEQKEQYRLQNKNASNTKKSNKKDEKMKSKAKARAKAKTKVSSTKISAQSGKKADGRQQPRKKKTNPTADIDNIPDETIHEVIDGIQQQHQMPKKTKRVYVSKKVNTKGKSNTVDKKECQPADVPIVLSDVDQPHLDIPIVPKTTLFKYIYSEFPYIDQLNEDQLTALDMTDWIVCDPGKRTLLYMKSKSGHVFCYTNKTHVSRTKRLEYQKQVQKFKDKNYISHLESSLTGCKSKSCVIKTFKKYIAKKLKINEILWEFYENETFFFNASENGIRTLTARERQQT